MQKIKNWLGFRKLDTKAVALLGIFVALTMVFTMYSTVRVGNSIEVSLKFIPVFVMGALFGPFFAGITCFLGDALSVILFPVGPPIIGMFLTEFLSGFFFGAFFYRKYEMNVSYIIRMVVCVVIQFVLSIILNSYFLVDAGYFSSMEAAISIRMVASLAKAPIQAVVIIFAPFYLKAFSKLVK
ncbi:MAG: folate family ECF transporter S component [Clostridia bacterium]|nr:folate family ECF transporter S component [Clostridia bacterium]